VRVAFKEWEIVVDALGRGDQILLLRKGGIHEGRGGFRPEHQRFLLFPTRYHQQRECVVASAQARFDEMLQQRPVSAEMVRVEFGAELAEARRLETLSQAKALHGQHIWRDEVIERRFDWGKDPAIHVLVSVDSCRGTPDDHGLRRLPILDKTGARYRHERRQNGIG